MNSRVLVVFFFVVFLMFGSRVSIDLPHELSDIPFTLQSLVVFLAASFLTPIEFILAITFYLFMGIIGLPVFAEGTSGWEKITGNSGGFLIGFIFSGWWISAYFKGRNDKIAWFSLANLYLQATIVLFFFGLLQLSIKLGVGSAFENGFLPYWKMSLFKALIASIIVYYLRPRFKIIGSEEL